MSDKKSLGAPHPADGKNGAADPGPEGRILVVDDDKVTATMIEKVLTKEGFEVAVVNDPKEVLNAELPFTPQVILMDVMMPGVSGIKLTRLLKKGLKSHPIRIIIFSALKRKIDIKKALEAGADAYLIKPAKRKQLIEHVRAQLRVVKAEQTITEIRDLVSAPEGAAAARLEAIVRLLRENGFDS